MSYNSDQQTIPELAPIPVASEIAPWYKDKKKIMSVSLGILLIIMLATGYWYTNRRRVSTTGGTINLDDETVFPEGHRLLLESTVYTPDGKVLLRLHQIDNSEKGKIIMDAVLSQDPKAVAELTMFQPIL